MKPKRVVRLGDQLRFTLGNGAQATRGFLTVFRRIEVVREVEIQLEMARFGTFERRVEIGERVVQARSQQTEAFSGAGFDQRADEQQISFRPGSAVRIVARRPAP